MRTPDAQRFLGLLESQDIYYHETNGLKHIWAQDIFGLRNGLFTDAEARFVTPEKPYFLSLGRNRSGRYRNATNCTLVLDGRALGYRYEINPVEYVGPEARAAGKSEQEDRLIHDRPTIPKARSYIREVHIYRSRVGSYSHLDGWMQLMKNTVPVFFYESYDDIRMLDKSKAVDQWPDIEALDYTRPDPQISAYDEKTFRKAATLLDLLEKGGQWGDYARHRNSDARNFVSMAYNDIQELTRVQSSAARMLVARATALYRASGAPDVKRWLEGRFYALTGRGEDGYPRRKK